MHHQSSRCDPHNVTTYNTWINKHKTSDLTHIYTHHYWQISTCERNTAGKKTPRLRRTRRLCRRKRAFVHVCWVGDECASFILPLTTFLIAMLNQNLQKKRGGESGALSVNENAVEPLNIYQIVRTVPLQVKARCYAGTTDKLSQ